MRSVLENDKEIIEDGKLISDSINQGLQSFTPDLLYDQLTKNYNVAKQIFGPSMIKLASGYNPDYVKKNVNIPEFRKELKFRIDKSFEDLKNKGFLNADGTISDTGLDLSSFVMYFEELEKLTPKGIFGQQEHKKISHYGSKEETRQYKKGDRYKDLAIKKSTKLAIRRGHKALGEKDLQVFERQSKGQNYIVYALDSSGSMKGKKIEACKKAGIALAYKAINEKDKVGLIVFGSDIQAVVEPTDDFKFLLRHIASARASKQTDFKGMLRKSIDLFPSEDITKHLIIITDAMPTMGDDPEKGTLKEIAVARNKGITVSLIGINLDEQGKEFARKVVELGEGKLHSIRNVDNVDSAVLEDYYAL
ncbi:VWA domain-containing protein [Candidatus Woesearchaeota archaeon]|nr:VWA domain-containing protein [Candidatus Woesearchaeota archaeon]